MKHLIITFLLSVLMTAGYAQTNHMKFKGIPMEGTLNSFVQKLKEKGYTYLGQQEGMALLKGEFAATICHISHCPTISSLLSLIGPRAGSA